MTNFDESQWSTCRQNDDIFISVCDDCTPVYLQPTRPRMAMGIDLFFRYKSAEMVSNKHFLNI